MGRAHVEPGARRPHVRRAVLTSRAARWGREESFDGQVDGADVEFHSLALTINRDGKLFRTEQFGLDDLDAAIARFDELATDARAPQPLTNAAVRYVEGYVRAITERDASFDQYAEDYVFEDRRSGLRSVVRGKEMGLATFRSLLDIGVERFDDRTARRSGPTDSSSTAGSPRVPRTADSRSRCSR